MGDEIDLNNAELFADSARGIFIPQHFAESVKRDMVSGVSDDDYSDLSKGPEFEWYWETWDRVLNNAKLNHPTKGECYLWQDGDLWIVPVQTEPEFHFIIEICPNEGRATACTNEGDSLIGSEFESDMMDCTGSGDAEPACKFIRDNFRIDWRIVRRTRAGNYRNAKATAREKARTCRAIYYDSERGKFADEQVCDTYLIWQAAHDMEQESSE